MKTIAQAQLDNAATYREGERMTTAAPHSEDGTATPAVGIPLDRRVGRLPVAAHRFDNAKRRRPDHHARQAMLTPPYVLEPVRELLGGIGLDPCTEPDNPTGAATWYSLPADGCALPWNASTVWCNPPYGEARDRWVDRCIAEGAHRKVVLLIPAHTETRTFQRALKACTSVLLVQSRLRFGVLRENGRQEAASHGSAMFGFGVDLSPLRGLGTPLTPNVA